MPSFDVEGGRVQGDPNDPRVQRAQRDLDKLMADNAAAVKRKGITPHSKPPFEQRYWESEADAQRRYKEQNGELPPGMADKTGDEERARSSRNSAQPGKEDED